MLTKEQKIALKIVFNSEIKNIAAWGGGTALSEIYLHHRQSEDIDIILSDLPPMENLSILANQIGKTIKASGKKSFNRMNRFQYVYNLKDNQLKLEFIYYPFPKIGRARKVDGIIVESLLDIAVSKVLSAYQRDEVKDALDLFVIFKSKKYSLEDLIVGVEKKFGEKIDSAILLARMSKNLSNLKVLTPLLLKKYSKKEISEFFQKLFNKYLKKQGI
jgi:predicted nucleotidyltransferase component of viral defense system